MPICPAGHDSATSDYCDVCGALMQGMSNPTPSLATAQGGGKRDTCPDCGTPQTGRFCEECGHDYGGQPVPTAEEERPLFTGPVLWAIMLFWVALAIGGLFFLYNALWAI